MSSQVGPLAEFQGLMDIKGIIIQTTSGLPLYEKIFDELGMDSALISGFSSALSSMFDGLDSSRKRGIQAFQGNNFHITLHVMEQSRLLILSSKPLPRILITQIQKTHQYIERKFASYFQGSKKGFREIPEKEVDKAFDRNNLKVLLVDNLVIDHEVIERTVQRRDIDALFKFHLNLIREFEFVEEPSPNFKLAQLIEFFKSKDVNETVLANFMLTAFKNEIFKRHY